MKKKHVLVTTLSGEATVSYYSQIFYTNSHNNIIWSSAFETPIMSWELSISWIIVAELVCWYSLISCLSDLV